MMSEIERIVATRYYLSMGMIKEVGGEYHLTMKGWQLVLFGWPVQPPYAVGVN